MGATQFGHSDLVDAFTGMAHGITRPKSIRWMIDDAVKGKPTRPLGRFPEVAEACLDAGGSYHNVTAPLSVMMAHLRRRFGKLSKKEMRDALPTMKAECDEAEAIGLRVALSVSAPAVSDLHTLERETTEAILALEAVREIVQDEICARGAR